MNPLSLPAVHVHEAGTVTVPASAAAALFSETNTVRVFQARAKDWDPVVRAVIAALLSVGRDACAVTSADASTAGESVPESEDLTLSGSPSGQGVSVAAAAELIGISRSGTRLACREGRLAAELVGSTWIVDPLDAQRFADDRKRDAA